jgi:carboxylate-amine ligase
LQLSVVESNTAVCAGLDALREELVRSRRLLVGVAEPLGLAPVAGGTVPLGDVTNLDVTPSSRYERMLADYQLLVREQLICGTQVHVQVSDPDLAVALAQRITPYLPIFLALSASSPFWFGEDSGYASVRSLMRTGAAGDVQHRVRLGPAVRAATSSSSPT